MKSEAKVTLIALVAWLSITAAWWALALWPVGDAPVWLERTRYVCFGVTETGLPDAAGWVGLIGGPLGMLAVLLVGLSAGVRSLFRSARRSRALAAALASLGLGVLVMAGAAAARVHAATAPVPEVTPGLLPAASYPRRDEPAPPLELIASDGVVRSVASLSGVPVLVTFAFAHCADVCPVIVRDVVRAQELLAAEGTRAAVLVVTLDPWRDTPARLGPMAKAWGLPAHDAWVLGGAVEDVEAALDAWRVPRRRDERTGAVTHPPLVYVLDTRGTIAFAAAGGAETIAALVRRL